MTNITVDNLFVISSIFEFYNIILTNISNTTVNHT